MRLEIEITFNGKEYTLSRSDNKYVFTDVKENFNQIEKYQGVAQGGRATSLKERRIFIVPTKNVAFLYLKRTDSLQIKERN